MLVFLRLALRRLAMLPVMVLGVTLLVFVVLQFSPADPAYNALGDGASEQARQAIAAVLALALGITGALYRDRWPDQLTRVLSISGVAVPSFWLGIVLIQELALNRSVLPTGGYVNPADSLGGWLETMILPAVSLAVPVAAGLARLVRTSMVAELDRDYVRTATGNGLPRSVVIRGVLRNALVTPLTVLGLRVGYLLSGAVVIETIFDLPGMGKLILEGVTGGDVALVQGTVLTIAVVFLAVNVLVDLLVLLVNPRVRTV